MKTLHNKIASYTKISPNLDVQLDEYFECIECNKGDILLNINSKNNYLYFIEEGILHNYYYHEGKAITSWFYAENTFVTAWNSFYTNQPNYEQIKCLENCKLYRISKTNYNQLAETNNEFNTFARKLSEEMLAFLDVFYKGLLFSSAKEKYELLKNHFPDVEQHVKLGLIASFLGISQETLSRIRRNNA